MQWGREEIIFLSLVDSKNSFVVNCGLMMINKPKLFECTHHDNYKPYLFFTYQSKTKQIYFDLAAYVN